MNTIILITIAYLDLFALNILKSTIFSTSINDKYYIFTILQDTSCWMGEKEKMITKGERKMIVFAVEKSRGPHPGRVCWCLEKGPT